MAAPAIRVTDPTLADVLAAVTRASPAVAEQMLQAFVDAVPGLATATAADLKELIAELSDRCANPDCGTLLPPWAPRVLGADRAFRYCDPACRRRDEALLGAEVVPLLPCEVDA